MKVNVTKSYLDLARSMIDTQVISKEGESIDECIFAFMSWTYVYSYTALMSFCSIQLHSIWDTEESPLKQKYSDKKTFEDLMATSLKDVKSALKELISQKGLRPLHESEPKLWQNLNEFVKRHRDFFLHPSPNLFHEIVKKAGNDQWQLPSATTADILAYIFTGCNG